MVRLRWTVSAALVLMVLSVAVVQGRAKGVAHADRDAEVKRWRYLVEEIAKCAECHTPRDAAGNLLGDQWLQGAKVWILPTRPIQNWADRVPPIAGLPGLTDAQAEIVLEHGQGPNGNDLRPPMHIYHMNREDAEAIIAYLRSLPQMPR
jgi:mono/diheme cytochrome c family protein